MESLREKFEKDTGLDFNDSPRDYLVWLATVFSIHADDSQVSSFTKSLEKKIKST